MMLRDLAFSIIRAIASSGNCRTLSNIELVTVWAGDSTVAADLSLDWHVRSALCIWSLGMEESVMPIE